MNGIGHAYHCYLCVWHVVSPVYSFSLSSWVCRAWPAFSANRIGEGLWGSVWHTCAQETWLITNTVIFHTCDSLLSHDNISYINHACVAQFQFLRDAEGKSQLKQTHRFTENPVYWGCHDNWTTTKWTRVCIGWPGIKWLSKGFFGVPHAHQHVWRVSLLVRCPSCRLAFPDLYECQTFAPEQIRDMVSSMLSSQTTWRSLCDTQIHTHLIWYLKYFSYISTK